MVEYSKIKEEKSKESQVMVVPCGCISLLYLTVNKLLIPILYMFVLICILINPGSYFVTLKFPRSAQYDLWLKR